ncbi:MAG: LytR C-terminal domain-containing protein [Microbacteriaceae bacterium]
MTRYPRDRFDEIPDDLLRVGAHREPPRKGRGWITLAWAALATLVLVLGGAIILTTVVNPGTLAPVSSGPVSPSASTSAPASAPASGSPSPTIAPLVDPKVPITILNGTKTPGLATAVGAALVAKGWAGVGAKANASQQNLTVTFVYYKTAAEEAAARGIVRDLGYGRIQLSAAFNTAITVVLGADHKPIP